MQEQEYAIVRALVPVAWADGVFADKEREILDALLDAYAATEAQKADLHAYAKERRGLEDIDLQELSAADRRVLLQHAVLVSLADGEQHPSEAEFLSALAGKLRIPADEAKAVIADAETRATRHLDLLG